MIDHFQIDVDRSGVYNAGLEATNTDWWFQNIWPGISNDSGQVVNEHTALTHAPLWQGITIIAGDLGMMPLHLMQHTGTDTVSQDKMHPGGRLVRKRPNKVQRPNTFFETSMLRAILHGNAVSHIQRDGGGRPLALIPLPARTTHVEFTEDGDLMYKTKVQVGSGTENRTYEPEDIHHIPGLSSDGVWGLSLLEHAQNTLGFGIAALKHGNNSFKNGLRFSGTLEHPAKPELTARQQMRQELKESYNTGDILLLWEGMKYNPHSMTMEQAQLAELLMLDRSSVASLLNLPPPFLNDLSKATFSNIEELNRWYLQRCLNRWLNKWVEESEEKLLTSREYNTESHFFKWITAKLVQTDIKSRYETYAVGIQNRILSPNDALRLEDMNPYEGGDTHENPNTTNASTSKPDANNLMVRRLVADKSKGLALVEAERLRRAAKDGNFVENLDKFYREEWYERLESVFGDVVAATYCSKRRDELLSLCECLPAELAGRLDKDSEQHADRAKWLVNLAYGGQYERNGHAIL